MRTFEGMHVSEGHKLKHGRFIEVQGIRSGSEDSREI